MWFEGPSNITWNFDGISLTFKFNSRRHFSWWTKYNCEFVKMINALLLWHSKWLNVKSRCLVGWTRFWCGYFDYSGLLRPSIPSEWNCNFFFPFKVIFLQLFSIFILDRTNQHSSLVGVSKFELILRWATLLTKKKRVCGLQEYGSFHWSGWSWNTRACACSWSYIWVSRKTFFS